MSIFQYLKRRPPIFFVVAGTVLAVMIAIPDYLLPWGVSFSIFYLIPVSFAAWYAGKGTGTYLALVSAGVWLAVDLLSRGSYANPYVPYWNALVRLGFFLICFTHGRTGYNRGEQERGNYLI